MSNINKVEPYYLIPAYVGIHLVLKNYMNLRWEKVSPELLSNPNKLKAHYLSDVAFYNMIILRENADLLDSIMQTWVDKHGIDTITFEDYKDDGRTLWDIIHETKEYEEYMFACMISGHRGTGVYDAKNNHFEWCCMAEHYNAIKIVIRKFYPDLTEILDRFEDRNVTSDEIKQLDDFILNDIMLIGEACSDKRYYTPTSRKY